MILSKVGAVALACAALCGCGKGVPDESASPTGQGPDLAAGPTGASPPPAAFAVCTSCHAVAPGRHGVGPSLAGIWERKAGTLPGYAYSQPLKTSGIVWNAASLDTWLQGPIKMVPGTKMIVGIPNPEGRKAVIRYLETLK